MEASLNARCWNRDVEAARYALGRRLVPVLRHHLVVNLQPMGMLIEIADRKITAGKPELEPVHDILARVNRLARASVASSLDVVGWLATDDNIIVPLGAGIDECLSMLRSNFTFRGFTVVNHAGEARMPVVRVAIREVFTAALIAATDLAKSPLRIEIRVETDSGRSLLTVSAQAVEGDGNDDVNVYRALTWADVEALAHSHGVELEQRDGAARLVYQEAVQAN